MKRLTRSYEAILKMFSEFDGNFMFGLAIGVIAISTIIYRFYGISFAMSPYGQLHLVSIDLFFLLIPVTYQLLRFEADNGKRVLGSLLLPIMVLSTHDIAWLMETFWVPQIYLNGKVMIAASLEEYSYNFSKNLINIIPCLALFLKYHYFKINNFFIVALMGMISLHIIDILFQINLYVLNGYALIIMELIDVLPFLFLLKKEGMPP